jgi:hypothetical protein
MFFPTLAWPSAQARRAKLRDIGYGLRSDFELNFGRYLPTFGLPEEIPPTRSPTDRRDTDTPSGRRRCPTSRTDLQYRRMLAQFHD